MSPNTKNSIALSVGTTAMVALLMFLVIQVVVDPSLWAWAGLVCYALVWITSSITFD